MVGHGAARQGLAWWGMMGADSGFGWLGYKILCIRSWLTMVFGNGNDLLKAYGNINMQELVMHGIVEKVPLPFDKFWDRVHNFVWVGCAPGMMCA